MPFSFLETILNLTTNGIIHFFRFYCIFLRKDLVVLFFVLTFATDYASPWGQGGSINILE